MFSNLGATHPSLMVLFVKEKELAMRSYQELADHEMDLWIKVNHPLFSNLFQAQILDNWIFMCFRSKNWKLAVMKLLIQFSVPPAKSPVHKTVSLVGQSNLFHQLIPEDNDRHCFSQTVSPFLKTCAGQDETFRYNSEELRIRSSRFLYFQRMF